MADNVSDNEAAEGSGSSTSNRLPVGLLRTCQNCFRAKIRCDRSSDQGPCDRCARLNKVCQFAAARRRQAPLKRGDRIDNLTARVDQIFGLLEDRLGRDSSPVRESSQDHNSQQPDSPSAEDSTHWTESGIVPDVISAGLLAPETAELLLEIFKSSMVVHFPFVALRPQMRVADLRHESPFLLLAIFTAASFDDMPLQRALGKVMRQAIAAKLVNGSMHSLEVLQGLLIHIAWSHFQPRPSRFTQHLQLAISIVLDMRLDCDIQRRPLRSRVGIEAEKANPYGREVERAVAGCYYLSSSISGLMQKSRTMPYTKLLDGRCKNIRDRMEHPSDQYIYSMVRLQSFMDRINAMGSLPKNDLVSNESSLDIQVVQLQRDIESFRSEHGPQLGGNVSLSMQFYTIQLLLCQVATYSSPQDASIMAKVPWTARRLELLSYGLVAAQAHLQYYLSLPFRADLVFNDIQWVQLSFACTFIAQLVIVAENCTVSEEVQLLAQSLNLSQAFDHVIARLGVLTSAAVDESGEHDVFHRYQQRAQVIQRWLAGQRELINSAGPHRFGGQFDSTMLLDPTQHRTGLRLGAPLELHFASPDAAAAGWSESNANELVLGTVDGTSSLCIPGLEWMDAGFGTLWFDRQRFDS